MLLFRSHRCNATKRNPEKEAKLLYVKPLIFMTDDELKQVIEDGAHAGVNKGIIDAQNELQVRDHIRGLMGNFKTKIVGLVNTGDVQPLGVDATTTKEEFARIFLDHDETLNNAPSNAQMKADYEQRLFETPAMVATVLAKDVEDNRSAIAEALTQRKKTLLEVAKKFVEEATPPFRRRRDGISKYFDSIKGKPTDQAIVVRNRKEFEDLANTSIYTHHNEKLRGANVLREVDENLAKIQKYRDAIRPVFARLGGKKPSNKELGDLWDGLEVRDRLLEARQMYINGQVRTRAVEVEQWQGGATDPAAFKRHIVDTAVEPAEQAGVEGNFDSQITKANTAHPGGWPTLSASTKMQAALEIQEDDQVAVAITEELESIKEEMKDLMDEIETFQTEALCTNVMSLFQKMDEDKDAGSEQSMIQNLKWFYGNLGIEWTTPMELYMGWKKYWEVRKQTKDEKQRRAAARHAQKFGKVIWHLSPFRNFENDVEQTLKAAVDNDDNSAKEAYMKLLKSGPEKFDSLFKPGGLYELNQHDPLRTKAVLEYAAEHGWLYDLNQTDETVMGIKLVAGKNLPEGEDVENYFDTLQSMDGSGADKVRNAAKSSISTANEWAPIEKRFKKELELNNLWGAIGIMEKAIERGKKGSTCPTLVTMFLRHMRNDANARKYVTKDMLDQIGNMAYANVIPGYVSLKQNQKEITEWAKSGNPENIEMMGSIGVVIKEAERQITAQQATARKPALDEARMDILVGDILAGQIVHEDGWSGAISVFDSSFDEYRKMLVKVVPGKVSGQEDFKQDSEVILLGGLGLKKILKLGSTGAFDHDDFARPFLGDIITKFDQLTALKSKGMISQAVIDEYTNHWHTAFAQYLTDETQFTERAFAGSCPVRTIDPSGKISQSESIQPLWETLGRKGLIKKADVLNIQSKAGSGEKEKFLKKLERVCI